MELTGKCKKDFEEWYNDVQRYNMGWFYRLQEEYQYGVYVDFFDSVGVLVFISIYWDDKQYFQVDVNNLSEYEFNTRQGAREQAITKANKIYNNK